MLKSLKTKSPYHSWYIESCFGAYRLWCCTDYSDGSHSDFLGNLEPNTSKIPGNNHWKCFLFDFDPIPIKSTWFWIEFSWCQDKLVKFQNSRIEKLVSGFLFLSILWSPILDSGHYIHTRAHKYYESALCQRSRLDTSHSRRYVGWNPTVGQIP